MRSLTTVHFSLYLSLTGAHIPHTVVVIRIKNVGSKMTIYWKLLLSPLPGLVSSSSIGVSISKLLLRLPSDSTFGGSWVLSESSSEAEVPVLWLSVDSFIDWRALSKSSGVVLCFFFAILTRKVVRTQTKKRTFKLGEKKISYLQRATLLNLTL